MPTLSAEIDRLKPGTIKGIITKIYTVNLSTGTTHLTF